MCMLYCCSQSLMSTMSLFSSDTVLIRFVVLLPFMQQLQCVKAGKLLPELPALSMVGWCYFWQFWPLPGK